MTLPAPTYDLTLMLDPEAEDATRAKIVADARAEIEARGDVSRYDDWGMRALTYPIDKKSSAEYHLLQFHAQSTELLADLGRTLRITDGILRFRIIKLAPGVPDAPDMRATSAPPTRAESPPAAAPIEVAVEVEVVEVQELGETPAQAPAQAEAPAAPETPAPVGEPVPVPAADSAASPDEPAAASDEAAASGIPASTPPPEPSQ